MIDIFIEMVTTRRQRNRICKKFLVVALICAICPTIRKWICSWIEVAYYKCLEWYYNHKAEK